MPDPEGTAWSTFETPDPLVTDPGGGTGGGGAGSNGGGGRGGNGGGTGILLSDVINIDADDVDVF